MKLSIREVVIAVMIATHIYWWCSCLHRAIMARTMRRCPTALFQPEGAEEPETNLSIPQQEEWADAAEGKITADYKLGVDYTPDRSDPENETDAQEEEENFDAEYAKIELPWQGTILRWSMNCRAVKMIEQVHPAWGPEIMTLWLHNMYLCLDSVPKQTSCSSESKD